MIRVTHKYKEPIYFYSSWERRLLACILVLPLRIFHAEARRRRGNFLEHRRLTGIINPQITKIINFIFYFQHFLLGAQAASLHSWCTFKISYAKTQSRRGSIWEHRRFAGIYYPQITQIINFYFLPGAPNAIRLPHIQGGLK